MAGMVVSEETAGLAGLAKRTILMCRSAVYLEVPVAEAAPAARVAREVTPGQATGVLSMS